MNMQKFMKLMGAGSEIDFSFISKESMKNQFCTDLYTKVGEHIQVLGTIIHVFYALKMGEKYRQRYGHYLTEPVWDREAIIYADLDMSLAATCKMEHDAVGHYARPDVLELKVYEK